MPALVFLGRKCRISSDDFYYPTLINIIFQFPVLILCILYVSIFRTCSTEYFDSSGIPFWLIIFTIPLMCLMMGTEMMMLHVSSKGTIVGSEQRLLMQPLIMVHLLSTIFEFIDSCLGFVLLLSGRICHQDYNYILLIIISLLLDCISSVLFACCALSGTKQHSPVRTRTPYGNEQQSLLSCSYGSNDFDSPIHENIITYVPHQERWERRCHKICRCVQCFTCNLFGGSGIENDSMSAVAEVLAKFFYGNPDLVVSDIVAGFLLLSAVQAHENTIQTPMSLKLSHHPPKLKLTQSSDHSEENNIGSNSNHITLQINDGDLNETIHDLAYFSKYAVGIYGWMLYIWSKPWTGVFRLSFNCCKKAHANIQGDTVFRLHQTALQLVTGLKDEDIIYASFENSVCQPAFCIVLDHRTRNVVIAVRGTLSLEDCLTDAIAHCCPLDTAGEKWNFNGKDKFAHQGMLHAAECLRTKIDSLGILETLFGIEGHPLDPCFDVSSLTTCLGYGLKVAGHSLGAGTAVLLAAFLRPKFPFLHCFAYSPPGCVISENAVQETEEYVTSLVLGKDIISRMSLRSMRHLRDDVLYMIERSRVNKAEILRQLVSWKNPKDLLYEDHEEVDTEDSQNLRTYRSLLQSMQNDLEPEKMAIPGRIIHLQRSDENDPSGIWLCCRPGGGICCTERNDYEADWSSRESFERIRIARTMLDDHFPDKVHHVINEISKQLSKEKSNCLRNSLSL